MPANNPYEEDENDPRSQGRAPNPTSFVNFQRYFGANKGVAEREAQNYATQATGAAENAQDALKKTKDQFGKDVAAGSVPDAPVKASTNTGSGANTSTSNAPSTNTGTNSAPPPAPGSNSGALTGESTRPETGGGMTAAQMQANADKQYTGPGGLGDEVGFQSAQDTSTAAEDQLNALGSSGGIQALIQERNNQSGLGTSGFSSGLIGEAGRPSFDKLRAQFNPNKDLASAQDAAGKTAAKAAIDSAKNADDWAAMAGVQGDAEKKQAAYDQAKADAKTQKAADAKKAAESRVPPKNYTQSYPNDTPENRMDYVLGGIDRSDKAAVAARTAEYANYRKAMTLTDQNMADRAFNDVNSVMSPLNWFTDAAGVQDPVQNYGMKTLGGSEAGAQTGSTNGQAIPWDKAGIDGFFVWRQMTPEQWAVLNSKPVNGSNGQTAWITTRAQQLRDEQGSNSTSTGAHKSQQ